MIIDKIPDASALVQKRQKQIAKYQRLEDKRSRKKINSELRHYYSGSYYFVTEDDALKVLATFRAHGYVCTIQKMDFDVTLGDFRKSNAWCVAVSLP